MFFPQNNPLDTQNAVLTTQPKNNRQNQRLVYSNSEILSIDIFCSKKFSWFKNCTRHVQCILDNPAEKLSNSEIFGPNSEKL